MLTRWIRPHAFLVTASVLMLTGPSVSAQQKDAFILFTRADTFSIERFVRTSRQLESEMVIKAAGGRVTVSAILDARGRVQTLTSEARAATADRSSPAAQRATITMVGDTVVAELGTGASRTTQRFGSRANAVPFMNPSFALVELVLQEARRTNRDTVLVALFLLQGGRTLDAKVIRVGRDSVIFDVRDVAARLAVSSNGEILGGEIPAQGLRLVRVRGAAESTITVAKADYSAPPSAPYSAIDVVIPTKMGHTLAGTLTLPKGRQGRVPAMVTITGSGSQDRDEAIPLVHGYRLFRQVADTLARHGIAVLRMDDRGFGGSGGDASVSTSADFADDIRAGLAYLRSRTDIDGNRLGLIGHSEGGLIAPMIAAEDSKLRGMVLLAGPSQSGRQILEYQQRFAIDHATTLSSAQRDSARRRITPLIDSIGNSIPWMRFFIDYDPLPTARRVRIPTLILQGATDRQVTMEQAEALARAMKAGGNRSVMVRVFPKANHLFVNDPDGNPAGYATLSTGAVRSDVLATIVEWVVARMR
ncbi:MAG: alpha/beta fold hydrolase [Gemmatimonadaceae bacterium]